MIDLTIVMAVYGQPLMLTRQLATIGTYPDSVRQSLKLVVVDDCGTPEVDLHHVAAVGERIKEARLYRVDKDIHWNQGGARNLAMQESSGWCAMIDPDMLFPASVIEKILAAIQTMKRGSNLRFFLKHKGSLDKGSPNTHIVHRDDFFMAGGYDEDFAGGKGYSDVMLARTMRGIGIKETWREDIYADFINPREVSDAMVTSISRDLKRNNPIFKRKLKLCSIRGGWKLFAQRGAPRIRFPWHRVL